MDTMENSSKFIPGDYAIFYSPIRKCKTIVKVLQVDSTGYYVQHIISASSKTPPDPTLVPFKLEDEMTPLGHNLDSKALESLIILYGAGNE